MVGESMTPVLEVSKLFAKSVKHSGENWLISVTFNPLAKLNESVGFSRFTCDHLMELIFWRFFFSAERIGRTVPLFATGSRGSKCRQFPAREECSRALRYVQRRPAAQLDLHNGRGGWWFRTGLHFSTSSHLVYFLTFSPATFVSWRRLFFVLCISRWWPTTTESFSAASVWRKTRWPMMIINQVRSIS